MVRSGLHTPQLCNLVKTAAVDVGNFVRLPLFWDMTPSLIREEQNPLLIRCINLKTPIRIGSPSAVLNLSVTVAILRTATLSALLVVILVYLPFLL